VLSGEVVNTYFTVFGLTQSGLEPMTYHTQGKHANHFIVNAVSIFNKEISGQFYKKSI
jgi:hypothetical protein